MNKKWIAINLVLLSIAGLLSWQLHVSIKRFNAENDLSNLRPVQDVKRKIALDEAIPQMKPRLIYNAAEFGVIPAQNVFSESRAKEEKTDVSPVVAAVPELTIKPVLVGVTLFGNQRLAAIVDPTMQGTTRRALTKRVGDVFQGYTITDITERQMVLEAGGRREIIPLHDGSKRQGQGGKTPILATRVVSIGKGSASTGASTATGAPTATSAVAPAARPSPVPAVPAQTAIGSGSGTVTAGSATGIRALPQQGRQTTGTPSPQVPATGSQAPGTTPPPGSRVIRTPFGDIVRPDVPPDP